MKKSEIFISDEFKGLTIQPNTKFFSEGEHGPVVKIFAIGKNGKKGKRLSARKMRKIAKESGGRFYFPLLQPRKKTSRFWIIRKFQIWCRHRKFQRNRESLNEFIRNNPNDFPGDQYIDWSNDTNSAPIREDYFDGIHPRQLTKEELKEIMDRVRQRKGSIFSITDEYKASDGIHPTMKEK